ncbi:MAG: MbcA/ParS/Xre antitoxin family protein [Pseudomonadota bacterium]
MATAFQPYPATRYAPPPPVDLSDKAERARLSHSALRGFFAIAAAWKLRDEDARALLGGLSNGPFYEWRKQPDRVLDTDRLTRISYLTGIFKALNILYGEALADRWMTLPNSNPMFGGRTPLDYLKTGGVPAMATLRRLLDARRGGV